MKGHIGSVSAGASEGDIYPIEKITLNFEEVQVEYVPQNADGSPGSRTMMSFNIPANC